VHPTRIDVFDKDFKQVDLPDCVFFAKQLPRRWRTRRPISSPAIWTSAGQPRVSRVPDAGFTGRVEYGVRPGIRHGRVQVAKLRTAQAGRFRIERLASSVRCFILISKMSLLHCRRDSREGLTMGPRGGAAEHNDAGDRAAAGGKRYRPGYELVAERLLRYIAEQNLRPGDRLPTEQGLADLLGTTRNQMREAVKVLAAVGRLSVRRGAGMFVASSGGAVADEELAHFQPTDMAHVLMLLDFRRLIEAETSHRAASLATPIQVRAIHESAQESLGVGAAMDVRGFARADTLFHDGVAIAADNVFLQSSVVNIRRFAAQTDTLLFHGDVPGSLEVAGRQHVAIAEAISAGDPERAAQLMTAHIDTTQQQFERKIRNRLFHREQRRLT
jgi:DNA-binding FadR family transcriptional regulator